MPGLFLLLEKSKDVNIFSKAFWGTVYSGQIQSSGYFREVHAMIPRSCSILSHTIMAIFMLMLASCDSSINDDSPGSGTVVYEFDFSSGVEGWTEGFADYPVGEENYYELSFYPAPLPSYLGSNIYGLYISGNNHSGDLFMYIKRRLGNLKPGTVYNIIYRIEIASDSPADSFGEGGSPGSGVYVHAGATIVEPESIIIRDPDLNDNYYRMNIDKGNQGYGGKDTIVLGNIGITGQNPDSPYKLKVLENSTPFQVSTDASGTIWAIIGTDSVFIGSTGMYYSSVKISLSEQQASP